MVRRQSGVPPEDTNSMASAGDVVVSRVDEECSFVILDHERVHSEPVMEAASAVAGPSADSAASSLPTVLPSTAAGASSSSSNSSLRSFQPTLAPQDMEAGLLRVLCENASLREAVAKNNVAIKKQIEVRVTKKHSVS